MNRKAYRDTTGDSWDGRTLEWSIASPAPFYNFAIEPTVDARDPFWEAKKHPRTEKPHYEDIHMPKNTSMGFVAAMFGGVFGFAMIWDMSLIAAVTGIAAILCVIARSFNFNRDFYVKAADVAKIEAKRLSEVRS